MSTSINKTEQSKDEEIASLRKENEVLKKALVSVVNLIRDKNPINEENDDDFNLNYIKS